MCFFPLSEITRKMCLSGVLQERFRGLSKAFVSGYVRCRSLCTALAVDSSRYNSSGIARAFAARV